MFDLSPIQIILVLVIALVALGPKRLPEMARSLGRGLSEFRGAVRLDGGPEPAPPAPPAPGPEAPRRAAVPEPVGPDPDVADLIVPAARPAAPDGDDEQPRD